MKRRSGHAAPNPDKPRPAAALSPETLRFVRVTRLPGCRTPPLDLYRTRVEDSAINRVKDAEGPELRNPTGRLTATTSNAAPNHWRWRPGKCASM